MNVEPNLAEMLRPTLEDAPAGTALILDQRGALVVVLLRPLTRPDVADACLLQLLLGRGLLVIA